MAPVNRTAFRKSRIASGPLAFNSEIVDAPTSVMLGAIRWRKGQRHGSPPECPGLSYRAAVPPSTTFTGSCPACSNPICFRISRATRGSMAELAPPTCGVMRTPGTVHSG